MAFSPFPVLRLVNMPRQIVYELMELFPKDLSLRPDAASHLLSAVSIHAMPISSWKTNSGFCSGHRKGQRKPHLWQETGCPDVA